jgi:uncharacterized membrane protein YdjX (TVP38/TMEM64 family)
MNPSCIREEEVSSERSFGIGLEDKKSSRTNLAVLTYAIILVIILLVGVAAVFFIYKGSITRWVVSLLISFDNKFQQLDKFQSVLLLLVITAISTFPPLFLNGIFAIVSGFLFHIPLAFIPTYFGFLVGSFGIFLLTRFFGIGSSRVLLFSALQETIKESSIYLQILIFLSPYPIGIVCIIFASVREISIARFGVIAAIGCIKCFLGVLIGNGLTTLEEINGSTERRISFLEIISLSVAIILGISVFFYISYYVKHIIERKNAGNFETIQIKIT